MSEKYDPIDSEIRAALAHDIDSMVQELDGRFTRFQPQSRPTATKPSFSFNFFMRPVAALAVLVVAVGMGFYLGSQQQNPFGPTALYSADPTLVGTSEQSAFIAVYEETSKQLNVGGLNQRMAADAASSFTNTDAAPTSAETSAPAEAESAAPESETEDAVAAADEPSESDKDDTEATTTASAAAPASPEINAITARSMTDDFSWDQFLSGLMSTQIASIGFWRKEVVVPNQSSVFRLKESTTQPETVTSGLRNPTGVAIDEAGRMYVTEHVADGALVAIETNGDSRVVKKGLNYPAGLAFAHDKSLYLAEQGRGRVLRLLPENDTITEHSRIEVFSTGFSGLMKTDLIEDPMKQGGPFALTITEDNHLLVSDLVEGKTAIYRFPLDTPKNWWDQLWGNF